MQKKIIKLTSPEGNEFLLGVESIIEIHWQPNRGVSEIKSRAAMITANWVIQTPEEIWEQINS